MAFINLLTAVYPVGSVYFSTINDSPANIIGGTWQAISGLNLGLPTKAFRNDGGFRAFQLGNVVFFGGFGKRPPLRPWEKTSAYTTMTACQNQMGVLLVVMVVLVLFIVKIVANLSGFITIMIITRLLLRIRMVLIQENITMVILFIKPPQKTLLLTI